MNIEELSKEELLEYLEEISQQLNNIALDQIPFAIAEEQFNIELKNKVIDIIVDTIVGDKKILKLICNKIINKKEDECFEQNKLCDDCIKEYFYNKVEIPEKN